MTDNQDLMDQMSKYKQLTIYYYFTVQHNLNIGSIVPLLNLELRTNPSYLMAQTSNKEQYECSVASSLI